MRIIAHLDMDSFFASVEERANPQFAGLGIVVGADPKNGIGRGVVSTANYQARKYGINSAMPISTAWRLSQNALKRGEPKTVFLPVNGSYYSQVSEKIFDIVRKYVRVVEQTSIDEAYLDLSFCNQAAEDTNLPAGEAGFKGHELNAPNDQFILRGDTWRDAFTLVKGEHRNREKLGVSLKFGIEAATLIIQKIKEEIKSREKLTAKVGIGPNKLIAKMASASSRPDGLVVIRQDEMEKFLDPLLIGDIPGLGPKSEEFFHKKKIFTIFDLKQITRDQLQSWMGKHGVDIYDKARGMDDSEVCQEREIKSVSEQETFEKDTLSGAFILDHLGELATSVIENMKNEGISAFKTVTIVVRFSDFTTKTRSHTLKDYTDNPAILKKEAIKLMLPFLDRRENPDLKKIRLIGAGIESFEGEEVEKPRQKKEIIEQGKLFNT